MRYRELLALCLLRDSRFLVFWNEEEAILTSNTPAHEGDVHTTEAAPSGGVFLGNINPTLPQVLDKYELPRQKLFPAR